MTQTRPLFLTLSLAALATVVAACGGSNGSQFDASTGNDATTGDGGGGDDGGLSDGLVFESGEGGGCAAPDMLIVLDRTLSMSREPNGNAPPNTMAGHALSKWVLATKAVERVTRPPEDRTIRFGLELLPLDPKMVADGGTGACVTLTQELGGTSATNTQCEPGQLIFSPALGNGAMIGTFLDPETTKLCVSTPISAALSTAAQVLAGIKTAGRKQFVLLVTDGGETCAGNGAIGVVQAMAASGVGTFVVGFGANDAGAGGVNKKLLNELACAGTTAQNFATACVKGDGGGYVPVLPNGPALYYASEDGAALEMALKGIATSICCGCVR